jgi:hypothetical protein
MPLVAPPPVEAPGPSRWAVLLRASDFYKEATKKERDLWDKRIIPVVELLTDHGGAMPDDHFAARMNVPRFRVPGVVTEIAERLNLEQHLVLTHDRLQGRVVLEAFLLEQLFAG